MATTRCERDEHGREVGVLVHEGREFRALGSTCDGVNLAAYLGKHDELKTWCGRTILDVRSERVGNYWTETNGDTFGIVYRLPRGRGDRPRFIVGYAGFGAGGLFRGELVDAEDAEDARQMCERVCERWLDIDAEDDAEFQEQCRREDEQREENERQEMEDMAERELERV